jgi:hypothetical protein
MKQTVSRMPHAPKWEQQEKDRKGREREYFTVMCLHELIVLPCGTF